MDQLTLYRPPGRSITISNKMTTGVKEKAIPLAAASLRSSYDEKRLEFELPQAIERLKPTLRFSCINPKFVCQQKALRKLEVIPDEGENVYPFPGCEGIGLPGSSLFHYASASTPWLRGKNP